MSDLGRQVKYGLGKETVSGTAVAASTWVNQLGFEMNPVNEYTNNESSFGVIERTNSSDITNKRAEGTLEAKLTDKTGGLILLGLFGSVATTDNADTDASVKDHTFDINQDIDGQSLTLIRKDSVSTKAYSLARIGEWTLEMDLDDYIKVSADIMSKAGETTTATPAYVLENEFVAKHFTVKVASDASGLAAATAESTVESFSLTVNPNLEADRSAGSNEPYGFSSRGYEMSFEMTCRYDGTTFEDAYENGTALALQVAAINTDVTIGSAANPGLVLTAPKFNITDWTRNEDMDGPVSQTFTGTIHYSPADAYALRAVLTNTQASY